MIHASITYQQYNERGDYQGDRHTETFDAEQTRNILDTLPVSSIETFIEDGTSNEEGDGFYYSAEAMALADNHYGDSFYVYIHYDEDEYRAYLADRVRRGIPEQGADLDTRAYHIQAKIAKINELLESLNDAATPIVWLAGDGSWGGLPGLGLYLPEQVTPEMREQYGIEDDNI